MSIKVFSGRVFSGSSVVSADDEVGGTIVLADDGVPDGFPWTGHTHSEGEESQVTHAVGILGHDGFVNPNASVMVDVTGFCETHDGVDEDVGLTFACGPDG